MIDLLCVTCGWRAADSDLSNCPQCGGTLDLLYNSPSIARQPARRGIWQYTDHLPVADPAHQISLGEGDTPLIPSQRVAALAGLPDLSFKMEGANPTGSYKDRIAAAGISRLVSLGKRAWAATSSGNAGAAIAAYGARAGVDGYLFTVENPAAAKLAQIMSYGPTVYQVERLGKDPDVEKQTWSNIRRVCQQQNWQMLVTARAFSPHAMEGAKTIAYEICTQAGGQAPDVVYVPVGGGGLFSMCWKGFVEWQAAGHAATCPRMVAVQPAGCDSIAQAWREDRPLQPIPTCESAISGLQLTAPPDGELVLRGVRESGGWVTSVPDQDTWTAQAELARLEGVFVEPAAAITLAAVKADRASGRLHDQERVVCLLTGIGFKDAGAVQRMTAGQTARLLKADDILGLAGQARS